MANDGGGSPHDLVVQTWIMYSIAMALYACRVYARFVRMGFKWQLEDYAMLIAVAFYLPGQFETFTAQDIAARVTGSKIEFASENCMLHTMYTLKACMLLIYFQLTSNLRQHFFVKLGAGYTFVGWFATTLVLYLNCGVPLSGYWTLPPPHEECATSFRYEVTQCVFNISSDIAILSIILPMLLKVKVPWKTKLPMVFIFSMGLVVVICACTSKYFTFKDIWDDSYQFWYLREASIGMYTTNLPYIWSLARQSFRFLRTSEVFSSERYAAGGPYSRTGDRASNLQSMKRSIGGGDRATRGAGDSSTKPYGLTQRNGASESDENIFQLGGVDIKDGAGMIGQQPHDFARLKDGSETLSWAHHQSADLEAGLSKTHDGIRKTTMVVVEKSDDGRSSN